MVGGTKNQYRGGGLPKKWWLEQCADLREEVLARKRGVVFLRGGGVDSPMHTMSILWSG